jgi:hypothetical protein
MPRLSRLLAPRRCRAPLLAAVLLLPLASVAAADAVPRTVHALDIDRIGPDALRALRDDPRVAAFVELGDRALVEAAPDYIGAQRAAGRWLATRELRAGEELRVHRRIHCEPGEDAAAPDAFGARSRWHVTIEPPGAKHGKRVAGDEVIAWQAANRPAPAPATADEAALAAIAASVDGSRWRTTLEALAAYNRQSAAGYNAALAYVMGEFAALGLSVRRECFTAPDARFNSDGRSCNVVAEQRGTGDDFVVVGAHLDSRNATFDDAQPSPGAEDNGSGCAGVLEVARVLAGRRPQASLLYQCYGLEERGLFGSRAHAETLTPARVRGVLNMDMIAFDGDGRLDAAIETRTAGRALLDLLAPLAARHTLLEAEFSTSTCCSDHVPYLDRTIPAVLLIENDWDAYPQYHTVDDTAARLSNEMAREIVKLAAVGAASLAGTADAAFEAAGYWYDPVRSGQGWHFERLPDGRVVATWYTFDALGAPLWIVANGTMDASGAARLDAFVAEGGRFPPAPAPGAVTARPWGELRFRFQDCSHGTVEWSPRAETGLAAGSAAIVRLTPAASAACAAR